MPTKFLNPPKYSRSKTGFTLIELMVTIAIIAILATVGMVIYSGVQRSARDSKRITDLRSIASALEQYRSINNQYPQIAQSAGGPWFCDTSGNFADNSQMISALGKFFPENVLPRDLINTGIYRYRLDMLKDNNIFFLYASLENPPQVKQTLYGVGETPPTGINADACVGTKQVDVLITNLQ